MCEFEPGPFVHESIQIGIMRAMSALAAAIVVPRWSRTHAAVESQVQPDKPVVTTTAAPVETAAPMSAPAEAPQNRSDNRPEPSQTARLRESQATRATLQPRGTHVVESAGQNPPVQTLPAQNPTVQAPPVQSPPAQAQNASGEELEALNNRIIQLGARANAAKASVDQIRQQQAASGFGLRQDVAASLSRMEAYMDAAERAVQGENPQAARKSMDQAEKEIDNLETFLGR